MIGWWKKHYIEIVIAVVAMLLLIPFLWLAGNEEGGKFIAAVDENGTPIMVEIDKGSAFLNAIGNDGTRTLILLLAGIVGWYFLSRRTEAMEQSANAAQENAEVANRTAKVAIRTAEVTEQGLATERFVQAMGQLASVSPSIRTGGILGLERVADSQEEERDDILRILSARIRELAPKRDEASAKDRVERLDIETAVRALARIAACTGDRKLELCYLQGADLHQLDLGKVDLSFFTISSADLKSVDLWRANLTKAMLSGANLTKATLGEANLTKAWLVKANLTEAMLDEANLTKAMLSGANLTKAILDRANLAGVKLMGADLTKATLGEVNLSDAQFGDDFSWEVTGLTQEQLNEAYYWRGHPPRNLPEGLNPPPEKIPPEQKDQD